MVRASGARMQSIETGKAEATRLFQGKDFERACAKYEDVASLARDLTGADSDDEEEPPSGTECSIARELQLKCLLNAALCHIKLTRWKRADAVATEALALDPENAKGLFRRAKARRALERLDAAKADLLAAAKLDPKNKDVHRELVAVQGDIKARRAKVGARMRKGAGLDLGYSEEEGRLRKGRKERSKIDKAKFDANDYSRFDALIDSDDEEAEEQAKRKALEDERKAEEKARRDAQKRAASGQSPAPAPAPATRAKSRPGGSGGGGGSSSVVHVDDEEDLGAVRGYKTKADGSKTTFFNNDLSDEAKALIGDITPKRVDPSGGGRVAGAATTAAAAAVATAPAPASVTGTGTASAWNAAGTWEEKDVTDWATPRLKAHLAAAQMQLGGTDAGARLERELGAATGACDGAVLRVEDVRDVEGDAQFAMVRGRERRFYDFAFKIKWAVKVGGRKYGGELAYQDVSTSNPDWDVDNCEHRWTVPTKPTAAQRQAFAPLVTHNAMRSRNGLRATVVAAVQAFVVELMAK